MTLTVKEIRAVVADLDYMPGWAFTVRGDQYQPVLRIEATAPDARRRGETTDLGIDSPIPPLPDEETLLGWLRWRVHQIACHEVDEFLLWRGERLNDPHKEARR